MLPKYNRTPKLGIVKGNELAFALVIEKWDDSLDLATALSTVLNLVRVKEPRMA